MQLIWEKAGWSRSNEGWMHPNQIVATYGFLKKGVLVYTHNKGKLRPLSDYLSDQGSLTMGYFDDAVLKAGESHFKFKAIYEAMKTFGRVNLKEIYIKEQPESERVTCFLYKEDWFVIAPLLNMDEHKERRILIPK